MSEYSKPVHIKLNSEEEKEVLTRIQSIQDKLKEAKSLADELASSLSTLTISVTVEAD